LAKENIPTMYDPRMEAAEELPETPVRVRYYGGPAAGGRAFQVEDGERLNFEELKTEILRRKQEAQAGKRRLRVYLERPGATAGDKASVENTDWKRLIVWLDHEKIPSVGGWD